ncbi:putative ABC transport system permease protein [Chitinophaga eiseniae]|uniref:Putative ABC transport system permease protein n=1 Tax=Chitinophaga eiseniae TaxID=634771 RepID=A0A1T4NJ76_9BACT|nr:ABC transporter permease [Chitinophaga eiseniae]SJZ79309.1 putative ABC transport system permease protein [Chitinophaga eiseniae]
MLKTYLTIGWRNLLRQKTFSLINLMGLAIGLTCFLLIALYIADECSYDRFHEKADRIYRIQSNLHWGGQDIRMAVTSDVMGPALKKDYPAVESYTRINAQENRKLINRNGAYIMEAGTAYVDSTFFDVFTFPAIAGDTRTALTQPNTVVLTVSAARKYFDRTDVLGQELQIKEGDKIVPYKVTAVIKDMPAKSHFHFDLLFPMMNRHYDWGNVGAHNFYTYLLLRPGTDPVAFQRNHRQFVINYLIPALAPFKINSMEEFEKAGNTVDFPLMPLKEIHLHSNLRDELSPPGSMQYIYIFSAVALFILLIACINFMNLTTAYSAGRSKEVGIRKVLGTARKELISQFLTESTLMAIFALLLAIGMAYLALPLFNQITDKSIGLTALLSAHILPWLIALPFVVGILAGSYPAFFLSGFKPVEVLKGKLRLGSKNSGLRSVLVVFQFATAVFLIIGTLVVYQQLRFIQSRNPGFDRDQVLTIHNADALGDHVYAFKKEMQHSAGVTSATVSSFLPVAGFARQDWNINPENGPLASNSFNTRRWAVDDDYIPTLGMQLVAGRNFRTGSAADSSAVIINQTTAKMLGYKDPVGKNVYNVESGGSPRPFTIIGVVKDFNYESMHQAIGPVCMTLNNWRPNVIMLKMAGASGEQVIDNATQLWKSMAPGMPFNYSFLDQSFDEMYRADRRVQQIALLFSILSITIACMGIFGLATFMAAQRAREISIRKVLGASVTSITQMLNRDFIRLVSVAFVIAAPFAGWAMHKWLESFAFRIQLHWWIFVAAGIATLLIALGTVSFQSVKAAVSNPLKNLRSE